MHLHNDPDVPDQSNGFLDAGGDALLVHRQGVEIKHHSLQPLDLALCDVRVADVLLECFPFLFSAQQPVEHVGRKVQVMSKYGKLVSKKLYNKRRTIFSSVAEPEPVESKLSET